MESKSVSNEEIINRILLRVGRTIAGKSNCPPLIADEIWKRIIREEIEKSLTIK
jgi:hypothetical protein